jgi:hypothetical protein
VSGLEFPLGGQFVEKRSELAVVFGRETGEIEVMSDYLSIEHRSHLRWDKDLGFLDAFDAQIGQLSHLKSR